MKIRPALVALALAMSVPGAAEAQSLFNSAGLGRPMEPIDGRSRALGGFGIGLQGGSLAPLTDPGATARVTVPNGIMISQPSWVEAARGGSDLGDFRGTRFPLVAVGYPVAGGMATVHLGSVLDQRFEGERTSTVTLGGAPVDVVDSFTQDGGVSSAGLGYARMLGERASLGVTISRYAGSVQRLLSRDFGAADLEGTEAFTTRGSWSYSGASVTAGATADVGTVGRVAASATWSSGLEATASSETGGGDRSYDMPLELRVGASAVLAPGLVLSASAVHADWAEIEDDLAVATAVGNTSGVGAGLELSEVRLLGRRAPLRLGYRTAGLPFSVGSEDASESAITGGLGFIFSEANGIVRAGVDLALERGERTAGPVTERFWRATVALRVAGF